MNRWIVCSFLASALGGCVETDSASYFAISFPTQPVQVDGNCDDGGCDDAASLEVDVDWTRDATQLAPDAQIEFYEYEVEYTFPDVDVDVPPFAALSQQYITDAGEISFFVTPMGTAQRSTLAPYIGGDTILSGTAAFTLAGWDDVDQPLVTNPATFNIWVGDFSAMTLTTTSGATSATP